MIWWKGKGLWLLTIVAVIVVVGHRVNPRYGVAVASLIAAVVIFLVKDWEKDSSVYSVPVKFWPPALLVLAGVTFFKG